MHRLIRRGLTALAVVGLLLAGAVGAAWIGFWLYGPDLARAQLEAALATALERPVRVGSVSFQPWPAALRVSGVTVARGPRPEDGALLRLDHGDVRVRLESLWRRQLVVAVTLAGLDVTITSGGSGGGLAALSLPDTIAFGPISVRVGALALVRGRIVYRDPGAGWTVEALGVQADGWPDPPGLALAAQAESLHIDSPVGSERLERGRADGLVRPGEVLVRSGRLRWEGRELRLAGQLQEREARLELRATVGGEVPLDALARRAGVAWRLVGLAGVEATLDGPIAALRVEARVTVPELVAGPLRARDVRLAGRLADGTLEVLDIRGDLPGGPVRGALAVRPEADGDARQVVLNLDGLRLPGVLAPLGPGAVRVAGRVAGGSLELGPATGRWAAARLDVAGRVDRGKPLALRAALDVDLGELARATDPPAVGGRARLTAEATGPWDAPVVSGRVETGSLTVAGRSVDPVDLRYRLEGRDQLSRWSGTLETTRITAAGVPADDLQAAFTIDAAALELHHLTGRVARVPVAARGAWTWTGTGRAQAELGPAALATLPGLPPSLRLMGMASGRLQAMAEHGTVSATGTIGLSDVALADIPLGSGSGRVGLNGREVSAELGFPARRVWAIGSGRLEEGRIVRGHARAERLDLDPLLRQFAPSAQRHVRGTISARVEAEVPVGRLDAVRATAWIEPDDLVVAGERWTARSPTVIRWERRRLSMADLRLVGRLGTLTASGAMDAEGREGRLVLALDDARLPVPLDRVGIGQVRAEAHLTWTALEALSLRARWPAWTLTADGQVPFDAPMAVRGRLTGDLAEITRALGASGIAGQAVVSADVTGRWSEPVATGRVEVPALAAPGVTLARVTLPFQLTRVALRIDRASALLGRDSVALEGRASWADGGWRGQGTLAATAVTVGGWPVEALRAAFAVDAERLVVTDAALRVAGVPAHATGSWAWAGGGRLEGRLGPASLGALPGAPPALRLGGTAAGPFQVTLRSLEDVTAGATLRLGEVEAAGVALGAGTLDLDLRARALGARLDLPERRLTAVAEGRAEAGAVLAVRAAADEVSLAELLPRLRPGSAPAVEGRVSARLTAEVPIDRPAAGRGTIRIEPLALRAAGEALASRGPIVARWDAGGLRVERFALEGRAGILEGGGSLKADGGLDAELRGRAPLALLAGLRAEVEEASGTLEVRAAVTGTASAPVIEGEGALRGGSLRLRGYPDTVREIEARFTGSPAGLRLTEARGALGGGAVTATGEAALAGGGLGAYRVVLAVRRVAVPLLDGLATLWDGDIELTGRGARGLLAGELRLLRGAYTRELAPAAPARAPAAGEPAEGGPALPLRVRVKLDDNLVVRNRTARLRVGGTLAIEGSTAAPILLGALEARDGTVVFRDRRFTVVTATARFVDPRRVDPFLDAVATARIRDYEVTVRVSGRADKLDVHLTSAPPLSQDDLLALVAFGVTRAELERSPAGTLAEEAARVVIRDLLGLEGLGGVLGAGGAGDAPSRLQVGTRLTQRSTLGEQGLESRADQRVRVEYQLMGPLIAVGERGLSGGYSAGIVLRLRFR